MVWSRAAARESRVGHEGDEAREKQRANPHGKDGSPAGRYCQRVRRRSVGTLTPRLAVAKWPESSRHRMPGPRHWGRNEERVANLDSPLRLRPRTKR
jgi:hypothetical protein